MGDERNNYLYNTKWSAIESIIFQSLLCVHQYMLFRTIESSAYGIIGTIFGITYFLIKIIDLGLNKSLGSFFSEYSQTQESLLLFLRQQIIPACLVYCVLLFFGVMGSLFLPTYWSSLMADGYVLAMVLMIVAIESIKAITKKLLQLSQHFRAVALYEIIFIIWYQVCIWGPYFLGYPITIFSLFFSFVIVSLFETSGLLVLFYRWSQSLPLSSFPVTSISLPLIVKNRFFSFAHTFSKQLISANVLVPFFAYLFGFESAALLKLASYLTHSITTIIEKIIDPTSSALFVHIKHASSEKKQAYFSLASSTSFHILASIFIFLAINGTKLFHMTHSTGEVWLYVVFYFLIHYSESLFIVTERFYIAHERSEFLCINTFFMGLVLGLAFLLSTPALLTLLLLMFSRMLSFFILLLFLYHRWGISHPVSFKARYIFGSLAMALLFFIIF